MPVGVCKISWVKNLNGMKEKGRQTGVRIKIELRPRMTKGDLEEVFMAFR